MLKYLNTEVTFAEIPDEITLCINITGCKYHCKGCHSPWLWENTGTELTKSELRRLIQDNPGISCVCFMGGDGEEVVSLALYVLKMFDLKTAWYSGGIDLPEDWGILTYIKLGPYIEELGGLDNPSTNQRLYKTSGNINEGFTKADITHKFWKNEN